VRICCCGDLECWDKMLFRLKFSGDGEWFGVVVMNGG